MKIIYDEKMGRGWTFYYNVNGSMSLCSNVVACALKTHYDDLPQTIRVEAAKCNGHKPKGWRVVHFKNDTFRTMGDVFYGTTTQRRKVTALKLRKFWLRITPV